MVFDAFFDYSVEGGKMTSPRKKSENRAARQAKTRDRPNSPVFTKKEGVHRERNTAAVKKAEELHSTGRAAPRAAKRPCRHTAAGGGSGISGPRPENA